MKRIVSVSISLCLVFSLSALAHSGRTDSNGGHRDTNNVSGLGSYHYHHGYSAHLHPGGVCPYDEPVTSSSNDGSANKVTLPTWNYYSNFAIGDIKDEEYDKGYANGFEKGKTETQNKLNTKITGLDHTISNLKDKIVSLENAISNKTKNLNTAYAIIGIETLALIICFFRKRKS